MQISRVPPEFLRRASIEDVYGIPKSTLYYLMKTKGFPKPVKLGRISVWVKAQIDHWLTNQAAAAK